MKVYQIIAENETLNELGVGKAIKTASKVFKGPKKTLGGPATTAKSATTISPAAANAAKETVSKLPDAIGTAVQAIGATGLAYNYWSEFHANEESYKAYQKDPTADTGFQNKSPEEAWAMYQALQQEALGKLIGELTLLIGPGVFSKVFKYGGKALNMIFPFAGSPLTLMSHLTQAVAKPEMTAVRGGVIAFLEGTETGRALMANGLALAITGGTGRAAQSIMDKMSELMKSYDGFGRNAVNALGKGIGAVSTATKGSATEPPEVAASKAQQAVNANMPRELRVTKNGKEVRIGGVEVIDAQGTRIPGLEQHQDRAQTVADAYKLRNPWLDFPQP